LILDLCYNVKSKCELINKCEVCETYGTAVSEIDGNVLECVWIEGNKIGSNEMIKPKCILRV
jgi:hypothetical protein